MTFVEMILLGTLVVLLAGTIKGLVGIGLPTASISLMTLFMEPRVAIALVLAPMVVSNAWQVWQMGEVRRALKDYAPFAVALAVGVFLTVMLTADVADQVIYLALGISIVAFSLVNLRFSIPPMPARFDLPAQLGFGSAAGILGGLSGVWGAPLIIYLTARGAVKDEFVRASGLLIFVGSLPLVAGYVAQGLLTRELGMVSVLLIVPTLIGFTLGAKLRATMSNDRFRTVLLYVFLLMGLNLLRRGIWG